MPLPYRPLFLYGENLALALELPITPWTRHTVAVGGDIEADAGARAAYIVRRDECLTFTLRFSEEEWPFVQLLIDYAQTGNLIVWYPDREDLTTQFTCYLDVPAVGAPYQVTADGEYPRVFTLDVTLTRGSWPLLPWNAPPGSTPPAGPTGWVIHFFTLHSDTFTVLAGSGLAEILVVGAGGSGGSVDGSGVGAGGGGAGGVVHRPAEPISVGSYSVQCGIGATSPHTDHTLGIGAAQGNNGQESFFGDIAAQGGGGGGALVPAYPMRQGRDGASGGGGASSDGDLITPPANNWEGGHAIHGSQGNDGGGGTQAHDTVGGGGGGAGGSGGLGTPGPGREFDIIDVDGSTIEVAQGGTAKMGAPDQGTGYGQGGGGGHALFADGGSGGSGLVVVKYQIESGIVATGGIRVEYPD